MLLYINWINWFDKKMKIKVLNNYVIRIIIIRNILINKNIKIENK